MELFLIQQQRKKYEKKISSVKSFADKCRMRANRSIYLLQWVDGLN